MGYRFRIHNKNLPGKPDIVLKKYNTTIFCHGCFWHQHPKCKRATVPKTNKDYWIPKLQRNVSRFKEIKKHLQSLGWNVAVVWECEVKDQELLEKKINSIFNGLNNEI
jgi:DNA mismatch endonuclease (patch repair protein)